MEIRDLDDKDLESISRFILDSYDDYPLAMWFDAKPAKEDLERLFYNKVNGLKSGHLVDMVTEQAGIILAECEIVRTYNESGIVGILVRKQYSRKRVGSMLLENAIIAAKDIGIYLLRAEVMADNENAIKFFIVNGFAPVGTIETRKKGEPRRMVILERIVK